jgi:hypothetical protein
MSSKEVDMKAVEITPQRVAKVKSNIDELPQQLSHGMVAYKALSRD